jgi:hypothetical protein
MHAAMCGGAPARTPVMCQLALGHYFLHAGLPAVDIWHDSEVFTDALLRLRQRYRFDGILVNLPGRDPDWRRDVRAIEPRDDRQIVRWTNGRQTIVPRDDNPYVVGADGSNLPRPRLAELDPDRLFYVEPHATAGEVNVSAVAPWQSRTVRQVRDAAPDISVHAEVFSPFSQLMELVGCEAGMLGLLDDPGRVHACMERFTEGAAALAHEYCEAGADAILISSAYAGGGLISRRHYQTFVLPHETALIRTIKAARPQTAVYTHTCGAIGDRLDLMEQTGTNGIDTLDPPPLGTVDLAHAKAQLGGRLFIKGNVDPVNTVLRGSPDDCYRDACARVRIGAPGGGYILSTACSVPPHAPPENVAQLARAAEECR